MPITLRPVEYRDIPAMARIRAREWETETYWVDRIGAYLSGNLSPQQALNARAAFAAMDGMHLAGFVAGHQTHRFDCDGELEWINVAEQWRGHGFAVALLAAMGAWFQDQGAHRVCVNVAPDNVAARRLYRSCGAQPLAEFWMVWEDARTMCAPRNE